MRVSFNNNSYEADFGLTGVFSFVRFCILKTANNVALL